MKIVLLVGLVTVLSSFVFSQTFDLTKGRLAVRILKDTTTVGSNLTYDHGIEAENWKGQLKWNSLSKTCNCEVTVPVNDLSVNTPKTRKFLELEGEISDVKLETIRETMLGKEQLDASNYPLIHFKSTSCFLLKENTLIITGDFTMKGVTKQVKIPIEGFKVGKKLAGNGSFQILGSEFGLQPYSAMFGSLKNRDELSFFFKWQ